MKPALKARKFVVRVAVVPPVYEQKLLGTKVEYKTIEIEGYTLKDAMKKAGIK